MIKFLTEQSLPDLKTILDDRYRNIPHLYYDMNCSGILEPWWLPSGSKENWAWETADEIISKNQFFFLHIIDTSVIAASHTGWWQGGNNSGFKQGPKSYKRYCELDFMNEGRVCLSSGRELNIYTIDVCRFNGAGIGVDIPDYAHSITGIELYLTCPIDSIESDDAYVTLATGMCFLCVPNSGATWSGDHYYIGTLVNGGGGQTINVDGDGGSCNCPTFSSSDAGKLIAVGTTGKLEGVTVSNYLSKY